MDIAINGRGDGEYRIIRDKPPEKVGKFSITPDQFTRLLERMEPFRRLAIPYSVESALEMIEQAADSTRRTGAIYPGELLVVGAGGAVLRGASKD